MFKSGVGSSISKRKFPGRKLSGVAASSSASASTGALRRNNKAKAKHSKSVSAKVGIDSLQDELNLLTSYASDTVYRLAYETMQYDYISPTVTKLMGFSVEEMKRLNFRSLIVETRIVTDGLKNVNSFDELEAQRRKGDVNKWQADYLIRTKDGRKIWISDVSYPWFNAAGSIIGSIGSLRDITDRVVAEEKIRKELQQISQLDTLTGLSNRKQFFDEVERELKRLNRSESDVSLLLVSIDRFKEIADNYTKDVSEGILRTATKVLQNAIRTTDLPARLGDEEFGILLLDTGVDGAATVAKRIQSMVLKQNFETGSDRTPFDITVSIGMASAAPGDSLDASGLFKLADTRMYIAKSAGHGNISVDNIRQTH